MNQRVGRGLCSTFLLLLVACGGGDSGSPEQQVRATLDAIELAVESAELEAIKAAVSEFYEDARGNDKRALVRFVTFKILGHKSRHVLSRIREVEIEGAFATVRLHAGLASSDLPDPEDWSRLRASIYAMDLQFALEAGGHWRLVSAAWRRATPGELL